MFTRKKLNFSNPKKICESLEKEFLDLKRTFPKKEKLYEKLKENNFLILKKCFAVCEEVLAESQIEMNFSGSTTVILLFIGNKILVANAGDSRAVMVKENQSKLKFIKKANSK